MLHDESGYLIQLGGLLPARGATANKTKMKPIFSRIPMFTIQLKVAQIILSQ